MPRHLLSIECVLQAALAALLPAGALAADMVCGHDALCRQHLDRGLELSQAAEHAQALRSFEAAYDRTADPRVAVNIGRTLHKLERYPEALDWYRLAEKTAVSDPALLAEIQSRRGTTRAEQTRERSSPRAPTVVNKPVIEVAASPASMSAAAVAVQNSNNNNVVINVIAPHPQVHTESRIPLYRKGWFWAAAAVLTSGAAAALAGTLAPRPWQPNDDVKIGWVTNALTGGTR